MGNERRMEKKDTRKFVQQKKESLSDQEIKNKIIWFVSI